jgi:hypothetical protein
VVKEGKNGRKQVPHFARNDSQKSKQESAKRKAAMVAAFGLLRVEILQRAPVGVGAGTNADEAREEDGGSEDGSYDCGVHA